MRKPGRVALVAAIAGLGMTLAACSSGGRVKPTDDSNSSGAGDNSGYTIAMITHETPGDTFWDKIKAGAQQAAKNEGINLKYSNDPDASKQARPAVGDRYRAGIRRAVDIEPVIFTLEEEGAVGRGRLDAVDLGTGDVGDAAGREQR